MCVYICSLAISYPLTWLSVLAISPIVLHTFLGASCASGLRWSLVQKLKDVDRVYHDPIYCAYSFGPTTVLSLLPFAVYDLVRYDDIVLCCEISFAG